MPEPKPLKTQREALFALLAEEQKRRRRPLTVEEITDFVLAQVNAFAAPYLENEWSGGEVLHQLRIWRKARL